MKTRSDKTRLNIRLPMELDAWIKDHVKKHNTTVTQLIVDYFTDLRKRTEAGDVPQC